MLCEICNQYKENCLVYESESIKTSYIQCAKENHKHANLSPILVYSLFEEYKNRINTLEDIIGRPNLKF